MYSGDRESQQSPEQRIHVGVTGMPERPGGREERP